MVFHVRFTSGLDLEYRYRALRMTPVYLYLYRIAGDNAFETMIPLRIYTMMFNQSHNVNAVVLIGLM